jgi:hypothetical protein
MFREALGYPTRAPEGGRSVIAGGLLLVSITICFGIGSLDTPYAYAAVVGLFPWLLVRGYYVRVIRTTIGRSRPTPPRFDDVRRLLADGATAVGIAIIYLFPGAVILGPLVGIQVFEADLSELLTAAGVTEAAVAVLIPVVGFVAVVALMSLLGALYVLPVAVGRFAHSGEWRSAIELRTVIGGALTEDYAIAWGVSFVLQAVFCSSDSSFTSSSLSASGTVTGRVSARRSISTPSETTERRRTRTRRDRKATAS